MDSRQVADWFSAANRKLEQLKGPFDFWGQAAAMMVRFCDGHGVHVGDLQELRQAIIEARQRLLSRTFGEDGPAFNIPAQQQFVELYIIIANAERVRW